MLSRRVFAFVSKRSAQRMVYRQFNPRKCRVCCQHHARFHAQSQLFKQELDMSVNTDPYEVKDLTENGENRVGPSVMEEEDKKNGHGKEESKKASKLQSNENLGYTKTLNIPFAVYAAIKKYVFSDDAKSRKFKIRHHQDTTGKSEGLVMVISGNPENIVDLKREILQSVKKLTCIVIPISLENFKKSEIHPIEDSFGVALTKRQGKSFFITGEVSACENAFKEIGRIVSQKGYSLPSKPKYVNYKKDIKKTFGLPVVTLLSEPEEQMKELALVKQISKPEQKSKQKGQDPVKQAKLGTLVERLQGKKTEVQEDEKVVPGQQVAEERGLKEKKPEVLTEQKQKTERETLDVSDEKLQKVVTEQEQETDTREQIPEERGQEKILTDSVGAIKQEVISEPIQNTYQKTEPKKQAPVNLELGVLVERLQEKKAEVLTKEKQEIQPRQQVPEERGKLDSLFQRLQVKTPEIPTEQKLEDVNGMSENVKAVLEMLEATEDHEVSMTKDQKTTRDLKGITSQTIKVSKDFLTFVKDNVWEEIQKQTGAIVGVRGERQITISGKPESIKLCKKELQAVANNTLLVDVPSTFPRKYYAELRTELNSLEIEYDVKFKWMTYTKFFIFGQKQSVSSSKEAIERYFNLKRIKLPGCIVQAFPPLWVDGGYSSAKESEAGETSNQRDEHAKEEEVKKLELSTDKAESLQSVTSEKSQAKLEEKVKVELKSRPPVVTIMGHVDHGKTTLLDALRKSKMVDQEFGGITQHIGAFQVQFKSGHSITFLDTPGHAAFSSMRYRGASVTDIVVLVVAAEDGLMDQTLESIKHAKRAKVPVIVAINKIDLPHADPEKVKYDLSSNGLIAEELGGDVQVIPISALKGLNLDKLQESIIAQAEVLELKADPESKVKARVIESKVDIGRGKQVTALIESGTLCKGDLLVSGTSSAKVRLMLNEHGKSIKEAKPGTPVVVTGWDTLPSAGEFIVEVENEVEMKKMTAEREKLEDEKLTEDSVSLVEERRTKFHEDYIKMRKLKKELHWKQYNELREKRKGDIVETGLPKFPVILKADVDGSLEVLEEILAGFHSEHIELSIVSSEVGDVNEGDYLLAQSVGARIYGFNVRDASLHREGPNVSVTLDNVIYDLFDNMVNDIKETLPLIESTNEIGTGEVLKTFVITDLEHGKTTVAGCKCISGMFKKDCLYRILRNDEVVYEGNVTSMKILKASVATVSVGAECGLGLAERIDLKKGDEVICLEKDSQRVELEWDHGLQYG